MFRQPAKKKNQPSTPPSTAPTHSTNSVARRHEYVYIEPFFDSPADHRVFYVYIEAFNFLWLFLLFAFGLRMLQLTSFSIGLLHFLFGARVDLKSKVNDYSAMNEFDDSKMESFAEDKMDVLALRRLVRIERERAVAAELELEKENDEIDVLALRRLVRIERERVVAAELELEKERMAAADETMAMILRLQTFSVVSNS
ncbi:hypothetical protein LINPERHAP1_LOCUS4615 [Linum perenne]